MFTLTTFEKWDEVLAQRPPPEDIRFSYTMVSYARSVAHAPKGEWAEAQASLNTVSTIGTATPEGAEGKTALSIAVHALSVEIATRRGDLEAGIHHFSEAAKIGDAGLYFEPSKWYYPSALARRRARESWSPYRGRERVLRGSPSLSGKRVVSIRVCAVTSSAGEDRRSG
ncbi:MAG: hypothetical protein U0223_00695 [Nitrospira sp.]|nr:hypothetical protein [Nitrospira sp.]